MDRSPLPPPPPSSLPTPLFIINSIRIPAGAEIVSDPDEEVFLLYSELQRIKSSSTALDQPLRGLGYVDSRKNVLSVVIELEGGEEEEIIQPGETIEQVYDGGDGGGDKRRTRRRVRNRANKKNRNRRYVEGKTIEIDLVQDVTGLRSRKGDTGSVVWCASVDFAKFVLQQAHLRSRECLFDLDLLGCQHILELGAGTGILSILLSSMCRRYTVTDIEDLVPLIRRNIDLNKGMMNSNIRVVPLDWVVLKNTPLDRRRYLFLPTSTASGQTAEKEEGGGEEGTMEIDILLIVDCIYHPSLLPPLIETIDYLTRPDGKTIVVVVVELRSEQVVREFLELWINSGQSSMRWKIYRCPLGMIVGPYVVWIGWKERREFSPLE